MMDEPKELTGLNQGDYDYPLADVSKTRNAHSERIAF